MLADLRGYGGSRVARSWSGTREIWDCNQDHSSGIILRRRSKIAISLELHIINLKSSNVEKIDNTDTRATNRLAGYSVRACNL